MGDLKFESLVSDRKNSPINFYSPIQDFSIKTLDCEKNLAYAYSASVDYLILNPHIEILMIFFFQDNLFHSMYNI